MEARNGDGLRSLLPPPPLKTDANRELCQLRAACGDNSHERRDLFQQVAVQCEGDQLRHGVRLEDAAEKAAERHALLAAHDCLQRRQVGEECRCPQGGGDVEVLERTRAQEGMGVEGFADQSYAAAAGGLVIALLARQVQGHYVGLHVAREV